MKTLYVTDLDGTLLNDQAQLTKTSADILNHLIEKGMLLTYATARSSTTASQITQSLHLQLPVIVHNGVFIEDEHHIVIKNTFDRSINDMLDEMIAQGCYPIIYSLNDNKEQAYYIYDLSSLAQQEFLDQRLDDQRYQAVTFPEALYQGDIYYLTLIGDYETLLAFKKKYDKKYRCILSQDVYSPSWWLEVMSLEASKAHAIKQLQMLLGCERVVVFGDGINDLEMFAIADEAYATQNADDDLKAQANAVIGHHNEDAVAHFLEAHYEA